MRTFTVFVAIISFFSVLGQSFARDVDCFVINKSSVIRTYDSTPDSHINFEHSSLETSSKHSSNIIRYKTWSGENWTAQLNPDGTFAHQKSDSSACTIDDRIDYIASNGKKWSAKVVGKEFYHYQNRDWNNRHKDSIINYETWNGSTWSTKIK